MMCDEWPAGNTASLSSLVHYYIIKAGYGLLTHFRHDFILISRHLG